MDIHEKTYIAEVVNYFCGPCLITPEQVTERVASVAYEALSKANTCSNAMDLVPRPTHSKPDIK
jgi:hypothetical protein